MREIVIINPTPATITPDSHNHTTITTLPLIPPTPPTVTVLLMPPKEALAIIETVILNNLVGNSQQISRARNQVNYLMYLTTNCMLVLFHLSRLPMIHSHRIILRLITSLLEPAPPATAAIVAAVRVAAVPVAAVPVAAPTVCILDYVLLARLQG